MAAAPRTKKTATKPKPAAKPSAKDTRLASLIALLNRGEKQLEGQMTDKTVKPAEGSVECDVQLQLTGDLVVAKGADAGPEKTVVDVSASDLVTAIYANMTPAQRTKILAGAFTQLKEARKKGKPGDHARSQLQHAAEQLESQSLVHARNHRLTKKTRTPARAGAVSGKPTVKVDGTLAGRSVKVNVA